MIRIWKISQDKSLRNSYLILSLDKKIPSPSCYTKHKIGVKVFYFVFDSMCLGFAD